MLTIRSDFTLTLGCGNSTSPYPVEILEAGDTLVVTLFPPIYSSLALTVIVCDHGLPFATLWIVCWRHVTTWLPFSSSDTTPPFANVIAPFSSSSFVITLSLLTISNLGSITSVIVAFVISMLSVIVSCIFWNIIPILLASEAVNAWSSSVARSFIHSILFLLDPGTVSLCAVNATVKIVASFFKLVIAVSVSDVSLDSDGAPSVNRIIYLDKLSSFTLFNWIFVFSSPFCGDVPPSAVILLTAFIIEDGELPTFVISCISFPRVAV